MSDNQDEVRAKQWEQILELAESQQNQLQQRPGGLIPTNNPYGLFNSINPWPGLAAPKIGPGRPAGTKLKDKDTLVQECVNKLSGHIASLCNKYNISENADIQTEVDLVETANYTTVILTATIDIPVHFTFVVQEKIKTSNKTASNVTVANPPMFTSSAQQSLLFSSTQKNFAKALAKQMDGSLLERFLNQAKK